jgi:hypothetical protein
VLFLEHGHFCVHLLLHFLHMGVGPLAEGGQLPALLGSQLL